MTAFAGRGVLRRAEGGDPPVGEAAAALERGGHVAAQPHVEGFLDRSGRHRHVGERAGRAVVADHLARPEPPQHRAARRPSGRRARRSGSRWRERSPPMPRPGTKVRRNRPPESWSRVATALASQTRLRPGSSMVVPILRRGQAPDAQASPTSGIGPGPREHLGQPEGVEAASRRWPRRATTMASGPRFSPPRADPDADLHDRPPPGARPAPRPPGDAVVVDVVVGHEAHRPRGDGMSQDAVVAQVGQQLVRIGVGRR